MKTKALLVVFLTAALFLTGCNGVYDKEYLKVKEYEISVQNTETSSDTIVVSNYSALRKHISSLVNKGMTEGKIQFDASYTGDVNQDLSSACWSVRTQNALCVYCVENISYEISKILTTSEATIQINYSISDIEIASIKKLGYLTGFDQMILNAFNNNQSQLILLVSNSSYSEDNLSDAAIDVYRRHPSSCVCEPLVTVKSYSGAGLQRLYDINIRYGKSIDEIEAIKEEISEIDYSFLDDKKALSDEKKAAAITHFLLSDWQPTEYASSNTLYAALVEKNADSEGLALAFNELAAKYGMSSFIIYGQKNRVDHTWNIIRIDNSYYHVDLSECLDTGELAVLKSDTDFWGKYRWNTLSYPACEKSLIIQAD